MKDKYLLTISIPTYNGSKTISKMLDVLLPQCDARVQVLISDNASTDNTKSVIESYRSTYPMIKYIRNDRNIGPDSNFLQCLELAEGKYTLLLSDDDILMENKLSLILSFLNNNESMSLVYLNAKGFHETYKNELECEFYSGAIYDNSMFVTTDKVQFMNHAGRMWGFLSCFICLTDAFRSIGNCDQFKKTNWLQSYIHILCSDYGNRNLGVISVPCIGAGIYSIISNFDSGRVDGITYKEMLKFAVKHGYSKKQLDKLFVWRICFIFKRTIIKERAAGLHKSSIKNVLKCTWMYPKVWVQLYPFFLVPPFACRKIVSINNRLKGYQHKAEVNRKGDVIG